MPPADEGRELVTLGVRLLDLVRGGARTTTYKPATLLALVEVLAAHADAQGNVPDRVDVRELAERVLALYWPQVHDFPGPRPYLKQSNDPSKGAVILDAVRELYEAARAQGLRSPWRTSVLLPREYDRAVRRVAANLCRYPLTRLQRPAGFREGQDYERLLYDDSAFGAGVRASLDLHPGIGERLLSLSGLLVPVLQAEWTQQVAALNDLPSQDLRAHLFGRDRQDLQPVRERLRILQRGRCLYCDGALRTGGQVDHVIPWSLHPQDAIENLALAHDRCNGSKSAYLLDVEPLAVSAHRDLDELAEIARAVDWRSAPARVFSLARAAYTYANAALLWSPGRTRLPDPGDLAGRILPLLCVA